jgi:hypothetical protein
MKSKLKAFVAWFILPYLTLFAIEFLVGWPRTDASTILRSFYWKVESAILLFCALQAGIGNWTTVAGHTCRNLTIDWRDSYLGIPRNDFCGRV